MLASTINDRTAAGFAEQEAFLAANTPQPQRRRPTRRQVWSAIPAAPLVQPEAPA